MGVTKGGGRLKLAWPPELRSPLTNRATAPTPLGLQRRYYRMLRLRPPPHALSTCIIE